MTEINLELAKNAVQAFLTSQYDKKTEKEQKQLAKAIEEDNLEEITRLKEKLSKVKEKYELEPWMDNAVNKMAKQIGFGTHISKGIHSSSQGDNINFKPEKKLPFNIVGHQSIAIHQLDASGNAAALPLYSFFEHEVSDGRAIKDFIIDNDENFEQALSKDKTLSKSYFKALQDLLIGTNEQPVTSEYNKQTLWPVGSNNYVCTVPLYPSSLTNYLFKKIQYLKYSDDISTKRKNRKLNSPDVKQQAYPTISNLAVIHLGGSNPQGVSRHMSSQRGVNYLLPSLPPTLSVKNNNFKPSKFARSIFSTSLVNKVNLILQDIYDVIESKHNPYTIREARKQAMNEILNRLFEFATYMRNELPAGWTLDHELDEVETFWLDPERAGLLEQADWKARRDDPSNDWNKEIMRRYARWINEVLQAKFEDIGSDFADPEHNQWERDIEAMQKQYERAGKGVFL